MLTEPVENNFVVSRFSNLLHSISFEKLVEFIELQKDNFQRKKRALSRKVVFNKELPNLMALSNYYRIILFSKVFSS